MVEGLPRLPLRRPHLQPGGRQAQVDFGVLRLFGISLGADRGWMTPPLQMGEPQRRHLVNDELVLAVLQRGPVSAQQPGEGHSERLLRFVPSWREQRSVTSLARRRGHTRRRPSALTVLGGAVAEHHPQVTAAHVLDGNRHLEGATDKSGN